MTVSRTEFLTAISTVALAVAERWGLTDAVVVPAPAPAPAPVPAPAPAPAPTPDTDPVLPDQEDGPKGDDVPIVPTLPPVAATGKLAIIPGWETPNNGICMSGGETSAGPVNGATVAGYFAWGVKAIRFALRSTTIMPGGPASPLHGKPTIGPAGGDFSWWLKTMTDFAKRCDKADVAFVLDNHTYRQIDDPDIGAFWATFGAALKQSLGGKFPAKFGIELVNEPKSNWPAYAAGLKANIKTIRDAGVDCTLFADHGFYSKYSEFPKAMALLDAVGGPEAIDPLNKTIFIVHDYPTPSGNDTPAVIKKGMDVRKRYTPFLDEARRRKVCVVMGEIGMGGGNGKFLPAEEAGGLDGEGFVKAYNELAREYSDVLKGTWCWSTGRVSTGYPFRLNSMTDGPHSLLVQDLWKNPVKAA